MASHQQPISAAREKSDGAARIRSREADAEAAEQPAKRSRTSKWDQQDSDAVPVVALPAQVHTVIVSAAFVRSSCSSQAVMHLCFVTQRTTAPPLAPPPLLSSPWTLKILFVLGISCQALS